MTRSVQHTRASLCVLIFAASIFLFGCGNNSGDASLALDPQTQQFLNDARSSLEFGSLPMAMAFTDSALARTPESADGHFLKAQLFLRTREVGQAEQAFLEVTRLNPDYPAAWFNLGNIAFSQQSFSEALEHYEKEAAVLERERQRLGAGYAVRFAETMSQLSLQKGRAYRQLVQDEEASTAFEEAIAFDSLNADAYADLSKSLKDKGSVAEALKYAEQALALAPYHPDYNYLIGAIKQEEGKAVEALPFLQTSIQAKPWSATARYNYGLALVEVGEQEAGELQLMIADTLQVLDERIEKTRQALEVTPDQPEQWLQLGTFLIQAGRIDEAVEPFTIASALQPNNLAIQSDIANLALIRGDTLTALRRWESIVAEKPDFADVWYNLGVIHALQNRYDEAEKAWRETLKHAPGHVEATESLKKIAS